MFYLEREVYSHPSAERELSILLRRHFSSRTAMLLAPLQRYLHTLLPTPAPTPTQSSTSLASLSISLQSALSNGSLSQNASLTHHTRMGRFSSAAFLASLKNAGAPLPFKSAAKRQAFYERWCRTAAFGAWLAKQEEEVGKVFGNGE